MRKTLVTFLFILHSGLVCAQLDNTLFEDRLPIRPEYANNLYLGINTFSFMKNNEYFTNLIVGQTFFGYQANPKLIYFPSANFRIEAGVFARKDFGNPNYTQIVPTYTIKYQKDSLAFLFGTLEGSLSHRLIEPLYDFERVIYDRVENGFQFLYGHRFASLDTWINWERMIYQGSPFQEVLTAGMSSSLHLYNSPHWKISIPLQIITSHQGGQIDVANLPALTLVNGTAGLSINKIISETGFIRNLRTDNYLVFSKDLQVSPRPFQQGSGTYLNLTLGTAWLDIMGSYWNSSQYIASRGGPLYQSVSYDFGNEGYVEPNRNIFILRLMHNSRITDQLHLSARLEPFYDFNSKDLEYSFGLYLHYRPMFRLKKEVITHD